METILNDWRIVTDIPGKVYTKEDRYILVIGGIVVADIMITPANIIRISTATGYAVQMLVEDKFISIIKAA